MQESTQHTTTEDSPTTAEDSLTAYGYCSWHQRFADDVRLIAVTEQGSGPGHVHYACGPCRKTHGLVPFADR
ncbi:hypothetical protein [Streptomyces viridosporus]|uniref:hypothetical protein n=1 Tax=Streptomyces viridosporus TaxID=67581 RepID=UPI0036F92921